VLHPIRSDVFELVFVEKLQESSKKSSKKVVKLVLIITIKNYYERFKNLINTIAMPSNLPFLEAICWQTKDIKQLSLFEMLNRYEAGWKYRGVLADLEGEELVFVQNLVKQLGSWIANDI